MAEAMMAFPELRHPCAPTPVHPDGSTTILYQGRRIELARTAPGDGLLIDPADLQQINGFALKPEGACYADLCVPVNESLLIDVDGRQWFDLEAFADLLEQPYVADRPARVWSFAEIPSRRQSMLVDAMAPDFSVTDRNGQVVSRADLKGKKALIVTWSSW